MQPKKGLILKPLLNCSKCGQLTRHTKDHLKAALFTVYATKQGMLAEPEVSDQKMTQTIYKCSKCQEERAFGAV